MKHKHNTIGSMSGFNKHTIPDLGSHIDSGLITIPEIMDKIKQLNDTLDEIKFIKSKLDNHIKNGTISTTSPSDYNLTNVLYREYIDKFGFTGSFEDFLSFFYRRMEVGKLIDMDNPIANKDKLASLELLLDLITKHDDDEDAHENIVNSIIGGTPFNETPRYMISSIDNNSIFPHKQHVTYVNKRGEIITKSEDDEYVQNIQNNKCIPISVNSRAYNIISSMTLENCTKTTKESYINASLTTSSITESNDNDIHKVTCGVPDDYNTLPDSYRTLSIIIKRRLRFRFRISINYDDNTSDMIKVNLHNREHAILTGGNISNVNYDLLKHGSIRYEINYHHNKSVRDISIEPILDYINHTEDSVLSYQGDDSNIAYDISDITLSDSPCLVQTYTNDDVVLSNSVVKDINDIRTDTMGCVCIEVYLPKVIDDEMFFKYDVGIYTIELYNTSIGYRYKVSIQNVVYQDSVVVDKYKYIRVAISFGQLGCIIQTNDDDAIIHGLEDYVDIPELSISINNQGAIDEIVQYYDNFPELSLKTFDIDTSTLEELVTKIYPYLRVVRDSNNTITMIEVMNSSSTSINVDDDVTQSKLYICRDDTVPTATCRYKKIIVWDIPAKRANMKYLTNKYTSMYHHEY